jgi:hypothetical protein
MANFAILGSDNIVTTIVAADTIEGPQMIFAGFKIIPLPEDSTAGQNFTYDEESNTFTPPTVDVIVDTSTITNP